MTSRYAGFTLVELPAVSKRKGNAFTLVELLVTVAIIAILLSLLLPVLKKTRYQARLVVCTSNFHQNGLALMSYAHANKGLWPGRWPWTAGAGTAVPNQLTQVGTAVNDLRPALSKYTKLNGTFRDPFVDKLDFMQPMPNPSEIYASYNMWFGWPPESGFVGSGWEKRMAHVDDWMEHNGRRINTLMSDCVWDTRPGWDNINTVHPDYPKGAMGPITFNGPGPTRNQISSWFIAFPASKMNRFDQNFLFIDGHAKLLPDLKTDLGNFDPRIYRVPIHGDAQTTWVVAVE